MDFSKISKESVQHYIDEVVVSGEYEELDREYYPDKEDEIGQLTDEENACFTLAIRTLRKSKELKDSNPEDSEKLLNISQMYAHLGYQKIKHRLGDDCPPTIGVRKGGLIVRDLVVEHANEAFKNFRM